MMRRVNISRLEPGMKLGSPIYNSRSDKLLLPGVVLTKVYIQRLRNLGFDYIWIEDESLPRIQEKQVVSQKTRIATIRKIKNIMLNTRATGRLLVHPETFRITIKDFTDQLFQNQDAMFSLYNLHSYDDYLFSHSVNVCILALMTGITLGYDSTRLTDLGTGALLHDLGKIKVPEKILNKPGKLTAEEFELVKMHTTLGYEIIRDAKNLGKIPEDIALEHHENYDGSGYPLGFSREKIPEYVQIVGIADRFDAIASDRVYRKAFPPQEAFEMCAASGNYFFKEHVVKAFLHNIAVYPQGTKVELNDGSIALVLDTPKGYPLSPRVWVLGSLPGRAIPENLEISLKEREDLYIVRVLNEDEEEITKV